MSLRQMPITVVKMHFPTIIVNRDIFRGRCDKATRLVRIQHS